MAIPSKKKPSPAVRGGGGIGHEGEQETQDRKGEKSTHRLQRHATKNCVEKWGFLTRRHRSRGTTCLQIEKESKKKDYASLEDEEGGTKEAGLTEGDPTTVS